MSHHRERGDDGLPLSFSYNGVELTRDDFPNTLGGHVAFAVGFAASVRCGGKEAALALLTATAEDVIKTVLETAVDVARRKSEEGGGTGGNSL